MPFDSPAQDIFIENYGRIIWPSLKHNLSADLHSKSHFFADQKPLNVAAIAENFVVS